MGKHEAQIEDKRFRDWMETDCILCENVRTAINRAYTGEHFNIFDGPRMIVCPQCGNKRCPKANWHGNKCTGSNAVGQEGSAYPTIIQHIPGRHACEPDWVKEIDAMP
jgi:hypothetical protein